MNPAMKFKPLLILGLAAALMAPLTVSAQRMSLADRVALLEQRAANNQANVDLLNQLTQLKSEVQALRSQLEELQQVNDQLKSAARAQYLDLDGRIDRLEGGGVAPSASAPARAGSPAAATTPAASATKPTTVRREEPADTAADRAPRVYGDAGAIAAQNAGERSAYDGAFASLKAGQYAESARLFAAFLQQHPNGVYTPNALYWLGESYYVTQNYNLALTQFQSLMDRYPTHEKTPGAMLKLGLSQLGLKQLEAAERTLGQVASRFPGTDAARTATDRLNAIRLNRAVN